MAVQEVVMLHLLESVAGLVFLVGLCVVGVAAGRQLFMGEE